jgi:hypothetical protein
MTGEARFTRWNLTILVVTALLATAIIAVTVVVRGHSNLVGKWAPVGAGIDVTQTATGPALIIDDNGAGGGLEIKKSDYLYTVTLYGSAGGVLGPFVARVLDDNLEVRLFRRSGVGTTTGSVNGAVTLALTHSGTLTLTRSGQSQPLAELEKVTSISTSAP